MTTSRDVEKVIAEIWADILGVGQVNAGDNFFELGGHSLVATNAMSRINKAFNVKVKVRALFEAPTLEGLAGRVMAAIAAAPPESGRQAGAERMSGAYHPEP